jgi:hypothetical protein
LVAQVLVLGIAWLDMEKKMNETAIVRFLAFELLGWEETWANTKTFDPFNNIAHSLMIVNAIKDDWFKIEWLAGLYKVTFIKPNMKAAEQTHHEHTSESLCEAIAIAAARAKATPEQHKEWGL